MESWRDYLGAVTTALDHVMTTTLDGAELLPDEGFDRWVALTRAVHTAGQNVYIIGNGGSAMIAGHFATDACKNAGLRAMAFNDASMLTAAGNDLSFAEVFAVPLAQLGRAGDLLITVSSSGNSPNIVRALEIARSARMKIVTLSGKGAGNRSRASGDLNFYVPANRYGWVESVHHIVMHHWLDRYLNAYGGGAI